MVNDHDINKPLIAVGLSFFEDVESLPRCISSILDNEKLRPYFKVLACDGVYTGYPSDHHLSEDGSRQIIEDFIKQYPTHIELRDYSNLLERVKRQRYVDLAASQGIPWLLIMDSDEYVQIIKPKAFIEELVYCESKWKETNLTPPPGTKSKVGNVFMVKSIDVDNNTGIPSAIHNRPRLWYRPEDMYYTTKHYYFARKDQMQNIKDKLTSWSDIVNCTYTSLAVENIVLWHDQSCRPEERDTKRLVYEQERLPLLEGKEGE